MRRLLNTCCVVFLLAGCVTTQDTSEKTISVTVAQACNAMAGALFGLAELNRQGKLSPSQVVSVDRVVRTVHPTCTSDNPPQSPEVVEFVQRATTELLMIKGAASAN